MKVHCKDGRTIGHMNTLIDGGHGVIALQKKSEDGTNVGMGVSIDEVKSIEIGSSLFVLSEEEGVKVDPKQSI